MNPDEAEFLFRIEVPDSALHQAAFISRNPSSNNASGESSAIDFHPPEASSAASRLLLPASRKNFSKSRRGSLSRTFNWYFTSPPTAAGSQLAT